VSVPRGFFLLWLFVSLLWVAAVGEAFWNTQARLAGDYEILSLPIFGPPLVMFVLYLSAILVTHRVWRRS
jgi:hypothetical protein